MKRTMSRSIIALVLAVAFLLGLGVLCFKYFMDSDMWASQTYNLHLQHGGGLKSAGTITDRNGVVLAKSEGGVRIYNEDYSTRVSTLHAVGDESYNIATALQTSFRAELAGHTKTFGYGLPESIKPCGDMSLTLDANTCAAVYNEFAGRKGACIVYNYKTGEVLCMVSTPSYDPQNVPETIPEGAYLNNVTSSTYAPGSIFKIVTTVAALEKGIDVDSLTFFCERKKDFGGDDVTCLDYHGEMNIYEAFAYSCNIAFADLATQVGAEAMQKTAERLGITSGFKVGSVNTAKGFFDVKNASVNELAWSGIGQYTDMVNPAQMAMLCGAIANGGEAKCPNYIAGAATGSTGRLMSKETADKMAEIMRYTISDYYGDSMFSGLTVGAKTGTAEVGGDKLPNGWMIGYSTDEGCPLAFAVVVEEGDYGFYSAGPIARVAMLESAKALGYIE